MPWIIIPIEEIIHALIPYISGKTDFDFEEDILCLIRYAMMLLRHFMCYKKGVSWL